MAVNFGGNPSDDGEFFRNEFGFKKSTVVGVGICGTLLALLANNLNHDKGTLATQSYGIIYAADSPKFDPIDARVHTMGQLVEQRTETDVAAPHLAHHSATYKAGTYTLTLYGCSVSGGGSARATSTELAVLGAGEALLGERLKSHVSLNAKGASYECDSFEVNRQ